MTCSNHELADRADYLRRIILVSEGIREIITVSSSMNLTAINSMLSAKLAGDRVKGFSIVSAELRIFSRRLELALTELNALIAKMVKDIALLRKQDRIQSIVAQAVEKSGSAAAHETTQTLLEQLRSVANSVACDWSELCAKLREAARLCQNATALSRNAKIEAVYGASMAPTLKQVAEDVDQTASAIVEQMKRLNSVLLEN